MKKLRTINITNTILKLFFFFAFPAAWATGFSGVKYLCEQIHSGKPIEMKAFLAAFLALAVFTIVFGRFFCGRACAFGTYGDILHEAAKLIAKKMHRRLPSIDGKTAGILRYLKYGVLVTICLLCTFGYGSEVAAGSPWTAFSHLRSGSIRTDSVLDIAGLVIFVLCSAGMIFTERFFCRFLCPFGAVFSLLPVLPLSIVSRDRNKCIRGCKACKSICPASLDLPYRNEKETAADEAVTVSAADEAATKDAGISAAEKEYALYMGECFQCGKCAHMCPKSNAGSMTLCGGTKGIMIDLCKAALLAVLLYKFI